MANKCTADIHQKEKQTVFHLPEIQNTTIAYILQNLQKQIVQSPSHRRKNLLPKQITKHSQPIKKVLENSKRNYRTTHHSSTQG